jgi:hypothetical protein
MRQGVADRCERIDALVEQLCERLVVAQRALRWR